MYNGKVDGFFNSKEDVDAKGSLLNPPQRSKSKTYKERSINISTWASSLGDME